MSNGSDRPTPSRLSGTGSPIVLLHGMFMTWRVWESVIPLIQRHHMVFAPTLAGHHGGPSLAAESHGVGPLADAVERQMDELGWQRAHLVGNSLGGWVAAELSQRGRAASVVLFSPAGASTGRFAFRRLVWLMALGRAVSRLPFVDRLMAFRPLRTLFARSMVANPGAFGQLEMTGLMRSTRACTAFAGLRAGLEIGQNPSFASSGVPTLVAWPRRDRTISWKRHGVPFCAGLPGCDQIFLDGVGHVPMYDDPRLVARIIMDSIAAATG